MEPGQALLQDPHIILTIEQDMLSNKRRGRNIAAGEAIWTYSLWPIEFPPVRSLGREIWAELRRGCDDQLLMSAAATFGESSGEGDFMFAEKMLMNVPRLHDDPPEFPVGLTPTPE